MRAGQIVALIFTIIFTFTSVICSIALAAVAFTETTVEGAEETDETDTTENAETTENAGSSGSNVGEEIAGEIASGCTAGFAKVLGMIIFGIPATVTAVAGAGISVAGWRARSKGARIVFKTLFALNICSLVLTLLSFVLNLG